MIPYANGNLLAIGTVGTPGDGMGDPGTPGIQRWTGSVGIYVDDSHVQITAGQRLDEDQRTRLEIPWKVGRLIEQGDTLTFTLNGEQQTGVAADLEGDPLVNRRRVRLNDR